MKTEPKTSHHSFRFRTGKGEWLTNEIVRIEKLASERIREGVSHRSVQTGALSLLGTILVGIESVELVPESPQIPACTPPPKSPR